MFRSDAARMGAVERVGVPFSSVLVGLLGALATGYLITVSIPMALGFLVFLGLFFIIVQYPAALVPGLVALTVVIERALQSVHITVGGRDLLNFSGVVNLCLAAAIVFYVMSGRMQLFQSLQTRSFVLYLAAVFFSMLISVDALMTIRSIVRITAGYCIYLMITQFVTERRQIDRLVQILIAVSVVPIAFGLYEIVVENHFVLSRDMRIKGTFRNGMSYTMYMAFLLPYIFGQLVFNRGGWLKKGFFAALFAAGVMNLIYTSTRIGWGAFALAMVIYGLLTDAKRLLPVILIAMFLGIVLFFPVFAKSFGGYFKTDWNTYFSDDVRWDIRSQDYITASSLHIRIYVWRNMLRELTKTNLWFGAGSGTWFEYMDVKAMGFSLASHSDYFEVLYGTGVVGLVLYLLFRIRQLMLLVRFAGSGIERRLKTTVLFPCLATHIACLGMSVTEVWQAYNGIYWLSWIMVGICEAYYRWYCAQESGGDETAEIPPDGTCN